MNELSRLKIGQRLVVGLPGTEVDEEIEELVHKYKIGNFILFKHNIQNVNQLKCLCIQLQELAIKHTGNPAFITIDQEGGMVTRLGEDCVNIPGAMALAALNNEEDIYQAGKMTGEQLKALGINFNLAPVADINSNMDNPVIGVRSYGDDPTWVAKRSLAMMKGLRDGGVLTSAKHFPGHGDTNIDSHLGLPRVEKTFEEIQQCELIPFQALVDAKVPAITTSHIIYPALDEDMIPATMSRRIITDLLKETMGFEGLVISDCMEMSAIQKYYGTIEGIKKAISAGVDLVFVSHTMELAREASNTLSKMLEDGELSVSEMDASILKIQNYKRKYVQVEESDAILFQAEDAIRDSKEMLKRSLTPIQMPSLEIPNIDSDTLFLGCIPFRATNILNKEEGGFHFAEYMAKYFHATGILTEPMPSKEEVDELRSLMNKASSVVIATYNAHLYKEQLYLVQTAAEENKNIIVFAMRNPYDLKNLPPHAFGIAVYEYTRKSLEVLSKYLEHPFELTGILPIKM